MNRLRALVLISLAVTLGLFFYLLNPKSVVAPNGKASPKSNLLQIFNKEVSVFLTGDIMLGRTVMTKSLDMNDPVYPFRKVGETLREVDIVFGNLEGPIIRNCPRDYTSMKFCADSRMVEGLKFAGVDVVSLANNHTRNYGKEGLEETKKVLGQNGIAWVGEGDLEIIEKEGVKFGFLGFDFVSKKPTDADYKLVEDSDGQVDILIVGVHWGAEYRSKASQEQKDIAGKLIASGADVIAGHHSHWVQEIDTINGKPVYYSLGNFIFDQMWSEKTKKGLAIKLTYRDGELKGEEKLPVYMSSWGQPEFTQ